MVCYGIVDRQNLISRDRENHFCPELVECLSYNLATGSCIHCMYAPLENTFFLGKGGSWIGGLCPSFIDNGSYFASTAAADFLPQPGMPGKPSAASPTSPNQSGIDCGRTPNFSTTPASSMSIARRRSQPTMRLPETSWATSLSGEQITICSTPASSLKRAVALDRASSASNSTIGQTTSPSAETASSESSNWAIRLGSTPAPVL